MQDYCQSLESPFFSWKIGELFENDLIFAELSKMPASTASPNKGGGPNFILPFGIFFVAGAVFGVLLGLSMIALVRSVMDEKMTVTWLATTILMTKLSWTVTKLWAIYFMILIVSLGLAITCQNILKKVEFLESTLKFKNYYFLIREHASLSDAWPGNVSSTSRESRKSRPRRRRERWVSG